MKTSILGIKAIAKREGTVLHIYLDSKKLPTGGVGHLLSNEERQQFPVDTPITQAQSDKWLAADLKDSEDAVNSIGADLEQNEFDALVSLTFNIGSTAFKRSTVARKLKAGDKKAAANGILLWDKPPEIQGRRRTEYNQFLTPYKDSAAASNNTPSNSVDSDANSNPPVSSSSPQPPNTIVEQTKTEATNTGDTTTGIATTVKTEQPKGDASTDPPAQVTSKGNRLLSTIAGWFGGAGAIASGIWAFLSVNPTPATVGMVCFTIIFLSVMFRKTIMDAVRANAAADPDKYNVK